MAEYRIRYIVGYDNRGRPIYHSVTVSSEDAPTEEQAMEAAFLQEGHLYDDDTAAEEIDIDEIRQLAPAPLVARTRARFVFDDSTGEWIGPLFDGPAHGGL